MRRQRPKTTPWNRSTRRRGACGIVGAKRLDQRTSYSSAWCNAFARNTGLTALQQPPSERETPTWRLPRFRLISPTLSIIGNETPANSKMPTAAGPRSLDSQPPLVPSEGLGTGHYILSRRKYRFVNSSAGHFMEAACPPWLCRPVSESAPRSHAASGSLFSRRCPPARFGVTSARSRPRRSSSDSSVRRIALEHLGVSLCRTTDEQARLRPVRRCSLSSESSPKPMTGGTKPARSAAVGSLGSSSSPECRLERRDARPKGPKPARRPLSPRDSCIGFLIVIEQCLGPANRPGPPRVRPVPVYDLLRHLWRWFAPSCKPP